MESEFAEVLRQALTQTSDREPGPIQPGDPIRDLGLDSISLAELVVMLEDRFDVSLERDEVELLVTFQDLEELVKRKREAAL